MNITFNIPDEIYQQYVVACRQQNKFNNDISDDVAVKRSLKRNIAKSIDDYRKYIEIDSESEQVNQLEQQLMNRRMLLNQKLNTFNESFVATDLDTI